VPSKSSRREIDSLPLDQLGTDFARLRLERPEVVKSMEKSLSTFGQLNPIIVRQGKARFQIIDGFKRYYAATALCWHTLHANRLTVTRRAATAMILTYNKNNCSLNDYEEALVLFSLKEDHHMPQEAIATLVGHSASWVSRRLALVEKLDPVVTDELKLGTLSSTQAREIVKLPRGNHQEVVKTIIDHALNTRQSARIIQEFLKTRDRAQQKYILEYPLDVLKPDQQETVGEYDGRLGKVGNRLLKTLKLTSRQMKWLSGQMDGLALDALTLLEWSILDPELRRVARLAEHLAEDLDQLRQTRKE